MDTLPASIKCAIKSIIESENFANFPSIEVSSGSQIGDGFASISSSIKIDGGDKIIYLFVKYCSDNMSDKEIEFFKSLFDMELYSYESIIPEMLKFQRNKGLQNIFDNVPKHYIVKLKKDGIPPIILDDLKSLGYTLRDMNEPADSKHINLILKSYAKFHATSFAIKDQNSELYKKMTEGIVDTFAEKMVDFGLTDTTVKLIKDLINSFNPSVDKVIIAKCQQLCESLMKFILDIRKSLDEYSVISHGDCWSNNMMFLYDKNTGNPIDLKLIDWQVPRLAAPALEAAHAFYALARREALDNFEHWRTTYYNTLAGHIVSLGSDPNKLYPKEIFIAQWKKFAKFGLIIAFSVNRVIFLKKEDIVDPANNEDGKMPMFPSDFKEKDQYHRLMRDLVEHFVHNDLL